MLGLHPSIHLSAGVLPKTRARLVPLSLNHTALRAKMWIAVKVITASPFWFFTA